MMNSEGQVVADLSRRQVLTAASVASGAAAALGVLGMTPRIEALAMTQHRPRVDHYTTGPRAELVDSITRVSKPPYRFTTLYSLKLPDLKIGDVVQAHSQFEVTNDLGFNVMIAHAMLVHGKETVVVEGDKPDGQVISEYAGENVTPDMHHAFRTLAGSFAASADGDAWLSVLIYAASDSPKPGDEIKVERGYGGLRAIVFRNVA
jgi:hypothetical protein